MIQLRMKRKHCIDRCVCLFSRLNASLVEFFAWKPFLFSFRVSTSVSVWGWSLYNNTVYYFLGCCKGTAAFYCAGLVFVISSLGNYSIWIRRLLMIGPWRASVTWYSSTNFRSHSQNPFLFVPVRWFFGGLQYNQVRYSEFVITSGR